MNMTVNEEESWEREYTGEDHSSQDEYYSACKISVN